MKKYFFAFLGLLAQLPVNASEFQCTVDLQSVLIYADGAVNIRHTGRNDYTIICNMNTPREGVSIQTCALWASTLMTMKQKGLSATFYYRKTEEYDSCATLPVYGHSPAPVYIGDNN